MRRFSRGQRVYVPVPGDGLYGGRVTRSVNGHTYVDLDDGEKVVADSSTIRLSNRVFIIESVGQRRYDGSFSEGRLLIECLNMMGCKASYFFIRTKRELGHFLKVVRATNVEHIHFSMHGHRDKVDLFLEEVTLEELIALAGDLAGRVVFSSGCLTGSPRFGKAFAAGTGVRAFIAPMRRISWLDGAIVSQLFYKKVMSDGASPRAACNFIRSTYNGHAGLRYYQG